MTKVCITGGAGFIAYHLAKNLTLDGYKVAGFDSYNDYYDPTLKEARSDKLYKEHNIHIAGVDLCDSVALSSYLKLTKPDIVVHLGAYAGVRHSLVDPDSYVQNNIIGTHNLIQAMKENDIRNCLYASTSCVMAGNQLPWKEDEKCGYQLNPYGYSKFTNESQMMSAPELDTAIGLRFFTVYGPWGRPDMALFDFTKNIIAGNPIQLFNNGNMIRDFTYVDDIVQGLSILIDRVGKVEAEKTIYNIGYGEQVQLMDFVDEIEKNLDRKAIKEYVPIHPADTQATWSDTSKLKALGYKPTTNVKDGVAQFIEWYKSYYGVN